VSILELAHPSRRRSDRWAGERHEPPRRARQPRTETGVRDEADGIAALFPAGRPCDSVLAGAGRRDEEVFDARASATTWILDQGLRPLSAAEQERIVIGWRALASDASSPLICDEGCQVRIGCIAIAGAAGSAILEWLPLSRTDLAVCEGGLFQNDPAGALALLVRPPTIWSRDDALIADSLFSRVSGFEPARFDALVQLARRCVRNEHLARVRRAVARIGRQIPVEGLPCSSATVAAGCAVIARDDARCAELAARCLARYASSALVASDYTEIVRLSMSLG
jgi:hypothetical protein